MNKRQAGRLVRKINKAAGYRVTGTRRYGRGDYALDIVYTESGDRFVINSGEQWTERLLRDASIAIEREAEKTLAATDEAHTIRVWYNDGDMLIDGGARMYDLDASCDKYDELVLATLTAAYPDTEIEIIRNRGLTGYCRSAEYDGRSDTHDAADVDSYAEDVYVSCGWLVTA